MNESGQMTQSLTTVLTWRAVARLKRTNAFMREWRVGGKFWEFHFSSLAILAHPPTTYVEYSEPWTSSEKASTHTSSYSKEVPWSNNAARGIVNLLWCKHCKEWSKKYSWAQTTCAYEPTFFEDSKALETKSSSSMGSKTFPLKSWAFKSLAARHIASFSQFYYNERNSKTEHRRNIHRKAHRQIKKCTCS